MQRDLDQFVAMMKAKGGDNLLAIVLYGSAATHEYSEKYSDINLLCVFEKLDAPSLAAIAPAMQWWERHGRAALVITRDELVRSADVFAIELLDMKNRHRILHGQDVLSSIEVPLNMHRVQVERELRMALIRLRQRYLAEALDRRGLLRLLVSSSSSITTLLRHTLITLGHTPPENRHEVITAVGQVLETGISSLRAVLRVRRGELAEGEVDPPELFRGYVEELAALVDKVDRRLAA
jgi:predicted nucleotidyltransferase